MYKFLLLYSLYILYILIIAKNDLYLFFYIKLYIFTDLVSFYTLPSTIMHHPTYRTLKAAYSFYNVSTKTPWIELMQDALISARDVSYTINI